MAGGEGVAAPIEIHRLEAGDDALVMAAAELFDEPPRPEAVRRFLGEGSHHLLVAYLGSRPAGFVSGVETTHPDKGTEMFLYELSVADGLRRRGIGSALVAALAALARGRGCYGMWVVTEPDNEAALATYRRSGATLEDTRTGVWEFTRLST